MYTRHFGLESLPFHPLSDPHVIFPSNEIREAVCHFRFSRENHEAFFLLTGQVGAGKTTAIRAFLEELPPESPVAVLTNGTLSTRDFLLELASQLKIPKGKRNSKRKLLTRLEAALRVYSREGRPAVLVLDEAHLMSDALLEEVRLLSNLRDQGHPLLYICLVGQSEIVARLRQSHMRPLRQRITSRYAMMPLREPETLEYVAARLRTAGSEKPKEVFHPSAARTLHRMSGGIPREINVLAGQAMMNAYVDHVKNVQRKHVRSVRKDYGFEGVRLPWYRALKLPRVRTFKPADTQPIVAIVRTTKPKGRTSRNPLMSYFPKSLD
ncbi:MAG: ExeA family protein, partial [Vicinamibacteria bacterium]